MRVASMGCSMDDADDADDADDNADATYAALRRSALGEVVRHHRGCACVRTISYCPSLYFFPFPGT